MMVAVAACISQLKWLWFLRPRALSDFESFDMASRGPWGSIVVLCRAFRYFRSLVIVAALVTVLSSATGPFLQQIISISPKPDPSATGVATTQRAQMYDEGEDNAQFGGGVRSGPGLRTKAAVYRGIFTDEVPAFQPFCSTGNCTFPLFDSLAMCSKCLNVTDDTRRLGDQGTKLPEKSGHWDLNLTYSLPGDTEVDVRTRYFDDSLQHGPALLSTSSVSTTMSKSTLGISNPMLALAIMQFPGVDRDGYSGNYLKETPVVYECALYFCVQTYNLTVVDGKTRTEVVSTWYNETDPVLDLGDNWHRYLERPTDQPTPEAPEGGDSTFVVVGGTFNTILWYLGKTLNGTALSRTAVVGDDEEEVDDVLEALKRSQDIPALFGNLTTSLSTRIREMSVGAENGEITGDALAMVPHVRIRWQWLSLPALVMALSSVLLVATAMATKRSGLPVWKNSSLAVLFHGLGSDPGADGGDLSGHRSRASEMNREADGRTVMLRRGEGGWKLGSGSL
ncbi:hypothetical protein F5X68DRAFT_248719 [Plectosphaerella plurivora]|uniref:Transmembrane protein n=1 Tax=Plectosphaerella plurivora TaxID=936078 RepID=A0A9P8VJX5_9PEZI|nr:hypothetical protein F5X68DRAFT_248719 [Plectosphaerella plurivora]